MNKSTSMKNTIVIYILINTLSSEVRFFYLKKTALVIYTTQEQSKITWGPKYI